jgi:hypothetical protein
MKYNERVSFVGIITIIFSFTSIAFAENRMFPRGDDIRTEENTADISREGEFLIDTGIVNVPVPVGQGSPAVAFDGTNYLVVWQDSRNGLSDIYGARIDQAGNSLDPDGIAICTATSGQDLPSVAFNGTYFLVVWQDQRSATPDLDIYGARVNLSGVVLDPGGIAISTQDMSNEWYPAVASDGSNFLVVWRDQRSGSGDIYGARISQAGIVLDPTGIVICPNISYQHSPDIAFDDTNYLVVWQDYRNGANYDIYGARVAQTGTVIDPAGIAISTASGDQYDPRIAFDGTNYMIAWEDYRNGVFCDIYGARVTQSGNILDTSGIAVSTFSTDQAAPSIVFNNTNFLVAWQDSRSGSEDDIYGARISQAGTVLDPTGIQISSAVRDQMFPAITFGTSNCLVVWQDRRNFLSACDIYGARIDQSGNILDTAGIVISTFFTAVNEQYAPDIAFDSINYLVVWQDNRSISGDICAARLAQSGTLLDSASFVVSGGNGMYYKQRPAVAFDGVNYLTVWEDGSDIYGARINPEGNILDTSGIAITTAAMQQILPALAFGDSNHFIVWQDYGGGGFYPPDIRGARIDQSGNVLDPSGITISNAFSLQGAPTVAFDGVNYFTFWYDGRSGQPDIYGARVNQSGNVLDPSGIVISDAPNAQQFPAVAFDGLNLLVVWQDERNGGSNYDIYGARVDQVGYVLDTAGIAICTTSTNQLYPAVAFDGTDYIIIWQDSTAGTSDIYGAKLSTSGVVMDSFAISLQAGNQNSPALAHSTTNQVLVTYSGWTEDFGGVTYDAMRIWGKFYPFVGVEEEVTYTIQNTGFNLRVYPNPARTRCSIVYNLVTDSEVNIAVFDVTGRLVREITNGRQNAGSYKKAIELSGLAQGVYFIKIESQSASAVEKVTLIK